MKIFHFSFIVSLILTMAMPPVSHSQNQAKTTHQQPESLVKCDSVWYYGLDLSHLRVSDSAKTPKCLVYGVAYPPAWIAYLEKNLSPGEYIRPALNKKSFVYVPDEIQQRRKHLVSDFIIVPEYSFPIDTVKAAVKGYQLSRTSGTGLVFIAENFSKRAEKSTVWVTFFDIRSREIIWAVKVSGECSHMGYTAHWGSGMVLGIRKFFTQIY